MVTGHGHQHADEKTRLISSEMETYSHLEESGHGHGHDAHHDDEHGHAHHEEEHGHAHQEDNSGNSCCDGHVHGVTDSHHGHGHGHGGATHADHHGHGHGHDDHHDDHEEDEVDEVIKLSRAVALCFCFMIVEIVGGYLAHSLAVLTDAAHLLSDVTSMAISIAAIKLAQNAATKQYTFGFLKAEVLGALISVMIIWVLTVGLVYEAILRLINPTQVDGEIMFVVAVMGLVVNISMLIILGGHGHSHGPPGDHGHAHDAHDEEGENINLQAAQIHVIGDLLQTVGVIIASVLIWINPGDVGCRPGLDIHGNAACVSNWEIADPACTMIFAVIVLCTTWNVLRSSISVLMMATPDGIDIDDVKASLMQVPHVIGVHDIRCWEATAGSKRCLSCHLVVSHGQTDLERACCESDDVLAAAVKMTQKLGFWHTTIQLEHAGGFDCGKMGTPMILPKDHHGHGHGGATHADHHEEHGHSHGGVPCPGHGEESAIPSYQNGGGHHGGGHHDDHGHGHAH